MTTPTATNTDPALRARIAAALTGIGEEAGELIARVAEEAANDVRDGRSRHAAQINAEMAMEAGVGRSISALEGVALEACVRAHLEATPPAPVDLARVRASKAMGGSTVGEPCAHPLPCADGLCDRCGWALSTHAAPAPAHPSPAEMAARTYTDHEWNLTARGCYSAGVSAERARLARLLLDRSRAALDRARLARADPTAAADAWGLATGEAEALSTLAEELL